MKLVGALGVILGGAMMMGCASGEPRAKAPSTTDVLDMMQRELSQTIGTTTLTNAPVAKSARDPNPPFLTDEAAAPAAARTWGGTSEEASTEADLARNPYTGARDIYDPR